MKKLQLIHTILLRRHACRPAAFLAVWGGQPKGKTPLADHKLHTARVRVCVGLAALVRVSYGVGGQPVLEVGVVGANIDCLLYTSRISHSPNSILSVC